MGLTLAADPLPLSEDADGRIRIAGKRVFLVNFINRYNSGLTAEEMVNHYDMLEPADIHAVLAYYFRNRAAVDEYVREKNAAGDALWEKIREELRPKVSREELLARWAARQGQ